MNEQIVEISYDRNKLVVAKISSNPGQNILELNDVSVQIRFAPSKTKACYLVLNSIDNLPHELLNDLKVSMSRN